MLPTDQNERLTRVERGAPMGDLVRRYWIPFLTSEELPAPDGDPLRVRLLGEDLVAFRGSAGRVGLIERLCAHRCADLFFGRNEEGGLRCTYHGWKYDVTGQCVDMPTEDEESGSGVPDPYKPGSVGARHASPSFKDKVRLTAYPVEERGGVLWAYMGPAELRPELPAFEFLRVPESHRYVSWNLQENNFAQAIEGGIDSAHSNFLHSSLDAYRKTEAWAEQGKRSGNLRDLYHARDAHPKFFAKDTDFGVLVGARRNAGEGTFYWRYNLFLMPFYTTPPGAPNQHSFHAFVPVDDVTTARWTFTYNVSKPLPAQQVAAFRKGQGLHAAKLPGTHVAVRNKSNDYLIDRTEQRKYTFTGITGTGEQDFSVQEGMGLVVDRAREHLGVTDIGIIAMRRRLAQDATNLQEGVEPYSASHGDVYHVRPGDVLLPPDAAWDEDSKVKEVLTARW